jgi:chromosome partitioning protein
MKKTLVRTETKVSVADLAATASQLNLAKTPEAALVKLKAELKKRQESRSQIPASLARQILATQKVQFPFKVFSFQMLKGGVAKTTSALNFGLRAAQYGCKVLFIDLDQQANLSLALGVDDDTKPVWIDIFEKKVNIESAVVEIESNVSLIPSSLNNSVLDRALLNSNRNWAQAVVQPLKKIRSQFDVVVIDTAPQLSAVNTAVTCASDVIVLPINPDKFAFSGATKHLHDLQELKEEFNLNFEAKVLFTKFDSRENSSHDYLQKSLTEFNDLLLNNYVRTSVELKNNLETQKSLFQVKSAAKDDNDMVTKELMGWLGPANA